MKRKILISLMLIIIGIVIGRWTMMSWKEQPLITPSQLQQQLCDKGYPVKVDGIIGKETILAWFRAESDESLAKYHTKSGAPEN